VPYSAGVDRQAVADPERAEIYLRLIAETELRRALATPKVRPRPHGRSRLRRSLIGYVMRHQDQDSARVRAARVLFTALGHRPIRRLRRFSIPVRWARRSWAGRRRGRPDRDVGMRRLVLVGEALGDSGVLAPEIIEQIASAQLVALQARQRVDAMGLRFMQRRGRQPTPPPSGPFRALGIGTRVRLIVRDQPAEIGLLGLVLAPDRAVFTIVAKPPAAAPENGKRDRYSRPPWGYEFLNSGTATDSNGAKYGLDFSGGGSDEEWTGQLELRRVPPLGVRWLELSFWPGTAPVRIDLGPASSQPQGEVTVLPRAEQAERYLDALTERLLEHRSDEPADEADQPADEADQSDLMDIVAALREAGSIGPASPALRRLVTLIRRLGRTPPPGLAQIAPTELPEQWLNVLDHLGAADGPEGVCPAAVVLPELDGTRWVLAGLRSIKYSAELQILGWGTPGRPWDHHYRGLESDLGRFTWWAKDNAGRWHFAIDSGGSSDGQHVDLELTLIPALHPQATTLDLVVTGTSGRVTATVPLDWRADS
jgi:hypothetical protein